MAEADEHHRDGDDAKKGRNLELQQEITWRQQQRVALRRLGIDGSRRQDQDDETAGEEGGRSDVSKRAEARPFARSSVHVQPVLHAKDLRRAQADCDKRMTPSNIGWSKRLARKPSIERR